MSDSVANRVKRNPRMCTVRTQEQMETKLKGMTNRQVWLSQFSATADWQSKIIEEECRRREAVYVEKQREKGYSGFSIGWWF